MHWIVVAGMPVLVIVFLPALPFSPETGPVVGIPLAVGTAVPVVSVAATGCTALVVGRSVVLVAGLAVAAVLGR